jgi:NAD(P)-dependent dehydrogenase (short-subunit alcohol dehydrogenase family)
MSKIGQHEGRRYIVVGGTNGMGFATAQAVAAAGAKVAIIGRDAARAQAKAAELGAGHFGDGTQAGGTGAGGAGAAVARCAALLGGLDGIAVTAGPINSNGGITELSDEDWQEAFETIFLMTMQSVRAALPLLQANGGGTIVTTAAYSIHAPKQRITHYSAMKAAVANLTKNIAKTYGAEGIRANCVAPGAVASEALDDAREKSAVLYPDLDPMARLNRFMLEDWGMKVAMNRVGLPSEVGELMAFLLSDAAGYMTGALINIDGGTDF